MAVSKDEVAAKADGIVSHMNNDHKDSLAYLATHYADLAKPLQPSQVLMTTIDSKHFEVAYATKKGTTPSVGSPSTEVVHVPFYPHLKGYSEVRTRMVDMSKVSEKVVTTRKPIIVYKAPKLAFAGVAILLAAYYALRSDTLPTHWLVRDTVPANFLAQWNDLRATLGGRHKLDATMRSIVRAHMVEGLLMALLCKQRGAGFYTTCKWAITTLIMGIPSWIAFFQVNSKSKTVRRAVVGDYANKDKKH